MQRPRAKLESIIKKITYMEDKKTSRLRRMIKFNMEILPALEGYDVESFDNGTRYKFYDSKYGYIDVYPMADKLLINKGAVWVTGAVKWIIKNIFWEDI